MHIGMPYQSLKPSLKQPTTQDLNLEFLKSIEE
jgi:hypothetical protein